MPFDPSKIWSSHSLPTLPAVAIRLLELSKDPETEIRDVVETIKSDPAISAKILKSANSSFFGFKSQVTSIERTVPLLGTTVVTSLALSFSLVDSAMTSGPLAEHYSNYWMQSIVQACAAETLATLTVRTAGLDCEFFQTGLLLDLGRLAMLRTIPQDYLPVLEESRNSGRNMHEVEADALGVDHAEVGVRLMRNWKLPEAVVLAAQWHHAAASRIAESTEFPAELAPLIHATAVASAVGDYFCSEAKGIALERLRSLTEKFHGFAPAQLDEFLQKTKARIDAAADLFSVPADQLGDPAELMALASEQLVQLAVREHVASTQAVAQKDVVEREMQVLVERNEELQKRALHDPLTQIYNRRFFDEALTKELQRCGRTASPVGLVFCDIDRFKNLNDTRGHSFGDEVLKRVARAFGDVIRQSDVLARYGGEEFVVLAITPTEKGLAKIAERIRSRVEAEEILCNGERVPVTVSVGAALAIPNRNDDGLAARLISTADEAMYDSKRNGRNQVHVRTLIDEDERRLALLVAHCRFSRWLVAQKVLDVPAASKALMECETPHEQVGTLSIRTGTLSAAQVDAILQDQRQSGERFGRIAKRLGLLDELGLARLLARQQEDACRFADVVVRLGLCDRQQADDYRRRFEADLDGQSARVHAARPAVAVT